MISRAVLVLPAGARLEADPTEVPGSTVMKVRTGWG
jgi:hypothetical protein